MAVIDADALFSFCFRLPDSLPPSVRPSVLHLRRLALSHQHLSPERRHTRKAHRPPIKATTSATSRETTRVAYRRHRRRRRRRHCCTIPTPESLHVLQPPLYTSSSASSAVASASAAVAAAVSGDLGLHSSVCYSYRYPHRCTDTLHVAIVLRAMQIAAIVAIVCP